MTRRHPAKRAGLIASLGALAILAGCGQDGDRASTAQLENGKQLFTQKCGSCHVLQDAQSKGTTGPDLDSAFGPSRQQGFKASQIAAVTKSQIELAYRPMPRNLVTGQDADDVSEYVATVAGLPRRELAKLKIKGAAGGEQKPLAEADAQNVLEIPANPDGLLQFQFKNAQAKPGALTVNSKNDATIPHNIAVTGNGVDVKGPVISGGKISTVKLTVKVGKYEFLCTVPGHAAAGMKGTLTIK